MSIRTIQKLALSAAAVAVLASLAGCAQQQLPSNVPPPAPALPVPKSTPSAGVKPSAYKTVHISASGFSPQKLTVKPNTLVTWVNDDVKAHNVTLLDTMRTAGTLARGQKASHLYLTVGTYPYRDSFDNNLQGVVWVK